MAAGAYFAPDIETLKRGDIDAVIDERVRYTITYAAEHSPFYWQWFRKNNLRPEEVRTHEDLASLPIVSGKTIRENQPPAIPDFAFLSAGWNDIFSIKETSGTPPEACQPEDELIL